MQQGARFVVVLSGSRFKKVLGEDCWVQGAATRPPQSQSTLEGNGGMLQASKVGKRPGSQAQDSQPPRGPQTLKASWDKMSFKSLDLKAVIGLPRYPRLGPCKAPQKSGPVGRVLNPSRDQGGGKGRAMGKHLLSNFLQACLGQLPPGAVPALASKCRLEPTWLCGASESLRTLSKEPLVEFSKAFKHRRDCLWP